MKIINMYQKSKFESYFVVLLLLVCSCARSDSSHIEAVTSFIDKELVFPQELQYQVLDERFDYNIQDADFKILTYIDAEGCTSCKMKLTSWNKILNKFFAIESADIKFLMIIDSPDDKAVNFLLKSNEFYHPVSLNSAKRFMEINKLPQNPEYQTFLLDADNRIIAVGNPVLNPKIEELYKSIIRKEVGCDSDLQNYTSFVDKPIKNTGLLNKGEKVCISYSIVNKDSIPYHIQEVVPSCDCINTEISSKVLLPESTNSINIQFIPDTLESTFKKYVDIYYLENEKPERLIIYGYMQ